MLLSIQPPHSLLQLFFQQNSGDRVTPNNPERDDPVPEYRQETNPRRKAIEITLKVLVQTASGPFQAYQNKKYLGGSLYFPPQWEKNATIVMEDMEVEGRYDTHYRESIGLVYDADSLKRWIVKLFKTKCVKAIPDFVILEHIKYELDKNIQFTREGQEVALAVINRLKRFQLVDTSSSQRYIFWDRLLEAVDWDSRLNPLETDLPTDN